MKALVPCSQCARHVRVSDSACPFCGAAIAANAEAKVVPSATQRLGRNATFVFATTLTLAACAPAANPDSGNPTDVPTSTDGNVVEDNGGPMPLYGGPVPLDVPTAADADGGGVLAMYGTPPPPNDDVPGDTTDTGSPGARYGAVPPPHDV